jgi:leucyl-tRNA synthetase
MDKYDPKKIEHKWQNVWLKSALYQDYSKKKKFYALDMFPYPSGVGLHVGHPKGFIATDIVSRYKMLHGLSVLHPMGWDAFGLPAENYALKNKIHPRIAVEKNIATFKNQLQKFGFTYDWDREINTTDPEYYKWTQWIFLQMFKKGLAYESAEPVNWCPKCKTVLANEDLEKGLCERCGSQVIQRRIRQWVLKITDYADRLLYDLDKEKLDWEELILEQQRNWIGRSEGAEMEFRISNSDFQIKVYTTRLDTIYGCTYCVVAPEHEIIQKLKDKIENYDEVNKYIIQAQKKTELERTELQKEKTGVELKGIKVINPFNQAEIPLFVADYVLGFYGTGAVMAVPAHDERDFEFAKKYKLPIKKVIEPVSSFVVTIKKSLNNNFYNEVGKFAKVIEGTNSWQGLVLIETEEIDKVFDFAAKCFTGKLWYIHSEGKIKKILFHCGENNTRFSWDSDIKNEKAYEYGISIGINKEQLDWNGCYASFTDDGVLINSDKYSGLTSEKARKEMTKWLAKNKIGKAKVNYKMRDWVFSRQRYWGEPIPIIHCAVCGPVGVPEKDLPVKLPGVKNYQPTDSGESPLANISEWVNTQCPKCGRPAKRETNTMPQWAGSCWYYLAYVMRGILNFEFPISKYKEEFKKWLPIGLYVGGAEHATRHLLYARFWHKFLYDIGVVSTKEPFQKLVHVGLINAADGRKMSKRWNNAINPDDIISEFGADAVRLYEMFMGPFTQNISWSTAGVSGTQRFLEKIWKLQNKISDKKTSDDKINNLLHKTIKKVGEDIENFRFNTAVSQMMILVNEMEKSEIIPKEIYKNFLIILSPFAPHIAEELWNQLGIKTSIFKEKWPEYDRKLIKDEEFQLVIQINGKVRDTVAASMDMAENEAKELAMQSEKVKKHLAGKEIKKVIFVKNRLINIVV